MNGQDHTFSTLEPLDAIEKIGRSIYDQTGHYMNHKQYLYLLTRKQPIETISELDTPEAVRQQEAIAERFHEKYGHNGLSEQDFMQSDGNIELERLTRYVSLPAHAHEFVECACVLQGTCVHQIEQTAYRQEAGVFTLIPPMVRHQLTAEEDTLCFTIKIRPAFFAKMNIPHLPLFIYPLSFRCGNDKAYQNMLFFLYQQQLTQRPYRDQLMESTITVLITYILQQYADTRSALFNQPSQNRQLLDILNFMYENFRTATLHETAEHFHFNEAYLSRMFHEKTGQSFSTVVKEFKLRKASELLITKNWKLEYICDAVGYKDTRQFIRSFKALYGVTPIQYRQQNANQTDHKATGLSNGYVSKA